MTANIIFICLIAAFFFFRYLEARTKRQRAFTNVCPEPAVAHTDILFKGDEAGILESQAHTILLKRHFYYQSLNEELQKIFVARLLHFISEKTFIIKTRDGFKEMPVLVSAAAIQLTFGLPQYLLPFYKYIRIFPEEYVGDHSRTILAGNVQNNVITVAWNHLLLGFSKTSDGSNVGLHEMSHALYIQKMVMEKEYAGKFSSQYKSLEKTCVDVSKSAVIKNLYSAYADTSLQEFWAETVELFFEKPHELFSCHPRIFEAVRTLLNQDPRQADNPLIENNLSFNERLKNIHRVFKWRFFQNAPR